MLILPRASESASKFCGGPPGAVKTIYTQMNNYVNYVIIIITM